MDHVWCLSYFDWESPLQLWFFSTEEKAKEAINDLLSGRKETHFNIMKYTVDSSNRMLEN